MELDIPIYVTGMSFGALSYEAKTALARGATMAGTATCSGEGGMIPDERRYSEKRRAEAERAARVLGLEHLHFLDLPDGELDLHVVNAIERHQSAPCFGHDAVTLALGKAWKAEAKHSPRRGDADLFDPAELQGRFATAGIFDLLEGLVGLLDRGHPFHQGKPDPRGAARDSP